MAGNTILLMDDDSDALEVVGHGLRKAGFGVVTSQTGPEALKQMYDQRPDLLILDINLADPNMDGITVCQRVREFSDVPIIMLTAQSDPEDIVQGLEAGADDYVIKPYNREVLLARVRANLRRAGTPPTQQRSGVVYSDGYLTINLDERRVLRDGAQIKLSPIEFNLLAKLVQNAPRVVSYSDLLESVWGQEYVGDLDYLRVYVWHLRKKLEPDARNPVYLQNELGVGYRFEKQS